MPREPHQPKPRLGILDYGMGNLHSVHRAFVSCGADARIVTKPAEMEELDALVFPGQGAIVDTMQLLQSSGWDEFIREWIAEDQPFFGICLGLQALFEHSEEGNTPGLGIFEGTVRRFSFSLESGLKIPHMGWNSVRFNTTIEDPLLDGISPHDSQFYFVHSYYAVPTDPGIVFGLTGYGDLKFCSAVRKGRLMATQFHPEKSQHVGLHLYRNFLHGLRPMHAG